MKRIVLEMGRGALFCPATGIQILGDFGCKPSPKTAFIYCTEVDEFEFVKPKFLPLLAEARATSRKWFKPFLQLLDGPEHSSLVVFTIKSGQAPGNGFTVHVGIDMNDTGETSR